MVPDSGGNSRHSLQPRVTETSWFLSFHTWKDSDKHAQRLCEPLVCLRYRMDKDSRQLQVKRRIWSEDWWWWGHNSHYREDNPDEVKDCGRSAEEHTLLNTNHILLPANLRAVGCCSSLIMDLTCGPPTLTLVKNKTGAAGTTTACSQTNDVKSTDVNFKDLDSFNMWLKHVAQSVFGHTCSRVHNLSKSGRVYRVYYTPFTGWEPRHRKVTC